MHETSGKSEHDRVAVSSGLSEHERPHTTLPKSEHDRPSVHADSNGGLSSGASVSKSPARPRGFAAMSEEQRRALGQKGGRTAHQRGTANKFTSQTGRDAGRVPHENGTAHRWTADEAREAGRKGGKSSRRPRRRPAEPAAP